MAIKKETIRKIYRNKDVEYFDKKIEMLGKDNKMTTIDFLNVRLIGSIIVFIISIYIFPFGFISAPIMGIAFHYFFTYYVITKQLKDRARKLEREALQFFQVLTLTIESGRNLEQSLEATVFSVDSELSNEFKQTLFETKFGKSLMESIDSMKKRIPSEAINNILLNITQTTVFGNNIIDTLHNQIDFLENKQMLEIKGEINKIPTKISIVSVLCVVPLILLLILGPAFINFLG